MSASGCLAPQDDPLEEQPGVAESESSNVPLEVPLCESEPENLMDDGCPPEDPNSCNLICSSTSYCNTQCKINEQLIACGDYGICQVPCSQICTTGSRCDMFCYQYGVPSTCGQSGACNPPPDCLVEFWTGYGYTGTRNCFGTKSDVEQVLANGGRLDVNQVSNNDQYSSFRTIEQTCRDRGISPCRFAGVPNTIKTGATRVYKDTNLSGKSKQFPEWVDGDADFDDDHWYDNWWQGDIDEKISSFYMDFSVAPTCYKAFRDGPSCGLCLNGGAWLQPFNCTAVANPLKGEGWIKVDATKNVWVFFYPGTYSPATIGYDQGDYRLHLQYYELVYPATFGASYDIEWHARANPTKTWFDKTVAGAF